MFQTFRFSRIVSLLFISLAVVFVTACGDDNDLDDFVNTNINNGSFAGRYFGANNLNAGQVGNLDVTVAANGTASGTYVVSNSAINQTITVGSNAVTGTVSFTTGAFAFSGNIPGAGPFTITGTLPTVGNVAAYTFTLNGQTFTGAIQPAAQGVPNPPNNNGGNGDGKIISGGTVNSLTFSALDNYNGKNPPVTTSSSIGGALGTGENGEDALTVILTDISLNGQTALTQLLTVSIVVPEGEDLVVGTAYPLVGTNGRGSFLTLNTLQGTTTTSGWAIGPNTQGTATITALNNTSVTLDFNFSNLVPNPEIANNTATGSFNFSGSITGNFANLP